MSKYVIDLNDDEVVELTDLLTNWEGPIAERILQSLQTPHQPSSNGALSRLIEELLMDKNLTYTKIVETVRDQFPSANTSTKSVASIACTMRKKGHEVPKRVMY